MTLDEAIKHAEEVADESENSASVFSHAEESKRSVWNNTETLVCKSAKEACEKCAAEHRQLAEWLRKYKEMIDILNERDTVPYFALMNRLIRVVEDGNDSN